MMICPKCGFRQPVDQYCANCGINIAHFKNKAKSKTQDYTIRNLVLVLSGLATLYIFAPHFFPFHDSISRFFGRQGSFSKKTGHGANRSQFQLQRTLPNQNPNPNEASQLAQQPQNGPTTGPPSPSTSPPPSGSSASQAENTVSSTPAPVPQASVSPTSREPASNPTTASPAAGFSSLKISYYEIRSDLVPTLRTQAEGAGSAVWDWGPKTYGFTLPNEEQAKAWLTSTYGSEKISFEELGAGGSSPTGKEKALGASSVSDHSGLIFSFISADGNPLSSASRTKNFSLRIQRLLPTVQQMNQLHSHGGRVTDLEPESFSAEIELKAGNIFLIVGLIPNTSSISPSTNPTSPSVNPTDLDPRLRDRLAASAPFSILRLSDFQNQRIVSGIGISIQK